MRSNPQWHYLQNVYTDIAVKKSRVFEWHKCIKVLSVSKMTHLSDTHISSITMKNYWTCSEMMVSDDPLIRPTLDNYENTEHV